jgi:NADH:ubiquinone oxidoreductase subunit 6 (subunit J)
MISIFNNTEWLIKYAPALDATIKPIGRLLLTDYLIAFEAASVLLLAAIIGAAMIARRKKA